MPLPAPAATPGNGLVYLSWESSQNIYLSIYEIVIYNSDDSVVNSVQTSDTTITINGLSNGQSYYFTVTPLNNLGQNIDTESARSNTVTPTGPALATIPSAPTIKTTEGENGQVIVNWFLPTSDGGSAITSYTVSSSPGNFQTTVYNSTATSATVTGLTNGTTYTFTVVATNTIGSSSPSGSLSETPRTIPNAPTIGTAISGNAQATVSWTVPNNGGSVITGYKVTSNYGVVSIVNGATTATTIVSGLTNGKTYTFTVKATNAVGDSIASSSSNTVLPISISNITTGSNFIGKTLVIGSTGLANGVWSRILHFFGGDGNIISTFQSDSPYHWLHINWSGGNTPFNTSGNYTSTINVYYIYTYSFISETQFKFNIYEYNGISSIISKFGLRTLTISNTVLSGKNTFWLGRSTSSADFFYNGIYNKVALYNGDLLALTEANVISTLLPLVQGTQSNVYYNDITNYAFRPTINNFMGVVVNRLNYNTTTGTTVSTSNITLNGNSTTSGGYLNITGSFIELPSAPTAVSATAGNGNAAVSWTASTNNGGTDITGYTVTSNPEGKTTTVSGTTTIATVFGLTNQAYTFTVVATNAVGPSVASVASTSVTPSITIPNAPTAVSATADNGNAAVSWTPPENNGGSSIISYTVTSSPGGLTATTPDGTTTNATVSGLTNGTTYTFTVVATNAVGPSVASVVSTSITPRTIPNAPTAVSATAGNGNAAVSWTAPSNGGSSIISYTVTSSPGGLTATTPDGTTTNATVSGLTNGTAYTFTVVATNIAGPSVASVASTSVTPRTIPNAPTAVSATAGNGNAAVSWTAPSNGGSSIISYTVTSSPGGLTATTPDGTTTNATVSGLTNGTAYTFTVVATNVVGPSVASVASTSVTPSITIPNAPTAVSATAGNGNATVSWTPPENNGGSSIISYTVTSSPGGLTATTPDGTTTNATVSGLTNGTAYTFTVVATNAVGPSVASVASTSVTPIIMTIPNAPTIGTAISGNGNATVSWTVPNNGGSDITGYKVTSNYGVVSIVNGATTTSTIVSGLTNGKTYTFTVIATNNVGDSIASSSSNTVLPISITTITTGSQLIGKTLVIGSTGLANSPRSRIIDMFRKGATISKNIISPFQDNNLNHSISIIDLSEQNIEENNINYSSVINVYYIYTYSFVSQTQFKFNIYEYNGTSIISKFGLRTITISNTILSEINTFWLGRSVTSSADPFYNGIYSKLALYNGDLLALSEVNVVSTLLNLISGTQQNVYYNNGASYINGNYAFRPALNNFMGITIDIINQNSTTGTTVTTSNVTVNGNGTISGGLLIMKGLFIEVPSAPTIEIVTPDNTLATVSWFASTNNGGSDITGYTVTSNPGNIISTVNGITLTTNVTGLTNGTAYTFTVVATNALGNSLPSSSSVSVTPTSNIIPDAPTNLTGTAGDTNANLSWTEPVSNGGTDISSYTVTSSPIGGITTINFAARTAIVSELTNGTAYTFTVTATNAAGTSVASNAIQVTPFTNPSAPTNVSAIAGNGNAVVTWTASTNNGGSAITSYTVISSPGNFQATTTNGLTTTATVFGLTNGKTYTFKVVATNAKGDSILSSSSNLVLPILIYNVTTGIDFIGKTLVIGSTGLSNQTYSRILDFNNNSTNTFIYAMYQFNNQRPWVGFKPIGGGESTIEYPYTALINVYYIYVLSFISTTEIKYNIYEYNGVSTITSKGAITTFNIVNTFLSELTQFWLGRSPFNVDNFYNGIYSKVALYNGNLLALTEANVSSVLLNLVTGTQSNAYYINNTTYVFRPVVNDFMGVVVNILNYNTTAGSTMTSSDITLIGNGAMSGGYLNIMGSFIEVSSAPIIGTATAGNAQAIVTWSPPINNGGSVITSYTVTSSPGGHTITVNGTTLSVNVAGLTNGTSYTFTVVALTDAGYSLPSSLSNSVIPFTIPNAPIIGLAIGCNNHATVIWNAPTSDGGSVITSYTVTSTPGGITATVDGTTLIADVVGLINQAYTFTVVATNAAGNSLPSSPSILITPVTKPSAPIIGIATAGNAQATITWYTPTNNGGSAITSYTVISSPGNKTKTVDSLIRTTNITGLTNGTAYTFTVVATNDVGISLPSNSSNSVIPKTIPSPPIIGTAITGNMKATVNWNAPISNGGSNIISYIVTSNPGGKTATVGSTIRSVNINTLTNGIAYTFTVVAINDVGISLPSNSSNSIIPITIPNAPTIGIATAGNARASVTWTAPTNNGGSNITGYTVISNPGGKTATVNGLTRTAIVIGLTNGITYTFKVFATNNAGNSLQSELSNSVIPRTIPSAPIIGSAIPYNTKASVSWTAPTNNGGSIITGYTITSNPGGKTITVGGSTRTAIITGLTNGIAYTFKVFAINAIGTSPPSSSSNSIIPIITISNAPTIGSATAYNLSSLVTWTPPTDNGGSVITSYTVISTRGGLTTTVDSSITSTIVNGLTNGTVYTFKVFATNAVGNSPLSSSSNLIIPHTTIPSAPIIENAIGYNTQATVSWNPPINNGGFVITSYTVSSNPGNIIKIVSGSENTAVVDGLTNGTSYTFKVFATNALGNSSLSSPSNPVTPKTIPSAPIIGSVTPYNNKVAVTWTAPINNGGSDITRYTVRSNPEGKTTTEYYFINSSTLIAEVLELTNGIPYNFTVIATNAAGDSLPSNSSSSVIPRTTKPSAPTIGIAIANNGYATVSWDAPANGGSIITSYTITSNPEGKKVSVNAPIRTAIVNGLTNGKSYTFTVVATNDIGNSTASNPSNSVIPRTIPSAPILKTATANDSQITVTWTAPINNGGSVITSYRVFSNPGNITITVDGSITTATFFGLIIGTSYTFKVVAINDVGNSPPSNSSISVTPYSTPSAPTGTSRLINNNKNVKFYVQNANKTYKKGFYHSSIQVYSNEIYEINNKIIQGNVPLENLINEIEFLKKKYNVYKNKENSHVYLTLLNLINTIRHKADANRYQIIANDLSKNLVIANNTLNEKIQELENCLNNTINTRLFKLPEINLVKNININQKYIIYIIEYGIPEDGIFLESLLEIIENTLM